eukprot:c11300_g1_i2.p1 GENE.c11300_g1_i2~~c11300_g1_i2.p1  ORF type:complete len:1154 (-),score=303.16 c11300_g1_i2:140-3601(-)
MGRQTVRKIRRQATNQKQTEMARLNRVNSGTLSNGASAPPDDDGWDGGDGTGELKKPVSGLFQRLFGHDPRKELEKRRKLAMAMEREVVTMTWSSPAVQGLPPSPRFGHTMTVVGTNIYIFGGTTGQTSLNELWVFETEQSRWSHKECSGKLPRPRHHHSTVVLPNLSLLVWGGIGGGDTVSILDISSFTWFTVAVKAGEGTEDIPSARWGHTSVRLGQMVIMIGGHDGKQALNEVWQLDLSLMTWRLVRFVGNPPQLGTHHTSCVLTESNTVLITGANDSAFDTIARFRMISEGYGEWMTPITVDSTVTALPPSRARHTAVLLDANLILLFGGVGNACTFNDTFIFSLQTRTWMEPIVWGELPPSRMDHAMSIVHGSAGTRIFMFGGSDTTSPLSDLRALVAVTWGATKPDSQPPTRLGHTLNLIGSKMYLIGGATDGVACNDVRVYDLEANSWDVPHVEGDPPAALVAHTSVVAGSELLIFGGGDGAQVGNQLAIFNLVTSTWFPALTQGRVPVARYGHAAAIFDNKMFVFGGYSVKEGYSNVMSVLDTDSLTWTSPAVGGVRPERRVGHTLTLVGNQLFLYGGSQDSNIFEVIHLFDVVTYIWTQPQLAGNPDLFPVARFGHSACPVGSRLFIFGGLVSRSTVSKKFAKHRPGWRRHRLEWVINELIVFDTTTMMWDTPQIAGVRPNGRFRHGCVAHATSLVIVGGHGGGTDVWRLHTGLWATPYTAPARKKVRDVEPQSTKLRADTAVIAQVQEALAEAAKATDDDSGFKLVHNWLTELGLDKFSRAFMKAEIDWESIVELTEDDVVGMGITALGPKKLLLSEIEKERKLRLLEEGDNVGRNLFLKRYRLERSVPFGRGVVKIAFDTKLGKTVVLKFYSDAELFNHEAELFRLLRSEFVADLLDVYPNFEKDAHCITLEYSGMPMSTFLKSFTTGAPWGTNERKAFFDRLTRMLSFFHSQNIVLCDMQANLFYLFELKWKVVDLSVARHTSQLVPQDNTPLYCSPETATAIARQTLYSLRASPMMDVWALAIMMVESFVYTSFLRADKAHVFEKLQSSEVVHIPLHLIEDPQAVNLLSEMTRKQTHERIDVKAILKHGYFTGGLDAKQLQEAFALFQEKHNALRSRMRSLGSKLQVGDTGSDVPAQSAT